MSWQATYWAKTTRGHRSAGDKLLLMILADYAHPETWEAWPNQQTLANDCEMSLRSVVSSLNSLEVGGFITRIRKGNQHQCSVYKLHAKAHTGATAEVGSEEIALAPESAVYDMEEVQSTTEQVNFTTSESEVPVHTSRQEKTLEKIYKEETLNNNTSDWASILSSDDRWVEPESGYVEAVTRKYAHLGDLTYEAHRCLRWLQTNPKGMKRKDILGTWDNWLKKAEESPAPPPPTPKVTNQSPKYYTPKPFDYDALKRHRAEMPGSLQDFLAEAAHDG